MRLIDADALRQKLLEELHNRSMQGFGKGLMIANSCVVNAPTIEPRKNGKWLPDNNSDVNGLKIVECSKCHKRAYGSGNYCPNCGAEMV